MRRSEEVTASLNLASSASTGMLSLTMLSTSSSPIVCTYTSSALDEKGTLYLTGPASCASHLGLYMPLFTWRSESRHALLRRLCSLPSRMTG